MRNFGNVSGGAESSAGLATVRRYEAAHKNPKSQTLAREIEAWDLERVWDLELGIWDFSESDSSSDSLPPLFLFRFLF